MLVPSVMQNFIYTYVLEKLKTEDLVIPVSQKYVDFLDNLPLGLELNQMRSLKDHKFTELRDLLTANPGSKALELIRTHCEKLGMGEEIYSLVFDSFWDLYTLHSEVQGLSAKKLLLWIPKVKLVVNE